MKINKIYNGDSLEVLKTFPDNSIDLCITSPPYNIGIDYGVYKDNLDWKKYYEWCHLWMEEIYRILKRDGRFCLNHYFSLGTSKWRETPLMDLNYDAVNNIGFKHHSVITWEDITRVKFTAWGSWLSASAPYISSPYEGILILYKEQWKKDKKGISTIEKNEFMDVVSGVLKVGTGKVKGHPAVFPETLVKKLIKIFSYKDDLILDPFIGSGTTAVVAKRLNRNYVGIELNPDYLPLIYERLNSAQQVLI